MANVHKEHDLYCVICGKKVKRLLAGKFCSEDCREAGLKLEVGSNFFCNFCGVGFIAKQANNRFCHDCYYKHPKCPCFYPSILESRKRAKAERKKADSSVCIPKDIKRLKKPISRHSIAEINELARASGLTYGQYVGKIYSQYNVSSMRAADKQKKEG